MRSSDHALRKGEGPDTMAEPVVRAVHVLGRVQRFAARDEGYAFRLRLGIIQGAPS